MSSVNYSNIAITKVLLLRGNTVQNDRYLGLPGEPTIDLEAKTLRIHDGTTVGGHRIESTANLSSYSGDIIPSANSVYSLGSITNQWKHLFVSSNTIYIGGTPLTVTNGNLTIGGNVVTGSGGGAALVNGNAIVNLGVDGTLNIPGNVAVGSSRAINNVAAYIDGGPDYAVFVYKTDLPNALSFIRGGDRVTNSDNPSDTAAISLAYDGDSPPDGQGSAPGQWVFNIGTTFWSGTQVNFIPNSNRIWQFDADGALHYPSGALFNGYDFYAAPNSYIELGSNNGNTWMGVENNDAFIQADWNGIPKQWTFDQYGNLTLAGNLIVPGAITFPQSQQVHTDGTGNNDNFIVFSANIRNDINGMQIGEAEQGVAVYTSGNIQFYTNTTGATTQWTFDQQGNLTLPSGALIGDAYHDGGTGLKSAAGTYAIIASHNLQQYVQVDDSAISLGTNWNTGSDKTWTLAKDGATILPVGNPAIYASDHSTVAMDYVSMTSLNVAQINGTNSGDHLTIQTNNTWAWQFNGDGSTTFPGNVTINGNLILNGNTTLVNTNNLIINDNIIYVANANPGSSLDIGFAGHFTALGRYQHTGLVRQATTNQWKLFSNVTAEPGATIDFTNAVYDDLQVGNITSPTIDTLNANALAQQTLISSLQGNATSQQSQIYTLQTNAATQSDLIIGINANVTQANLGILGYINLGNTIQSAQVNAANLAITAANVGMKGYVDSQTFYSNARVATYLQVGNIANISVAGNVTATYFVGNGALLTGIAASSNYSNVQVATYLPTYTGNIANIRLGVSGVLTFPDGTTMTTAASGTGGSNYSNVNVAAYLAGTITVGNLTATGTVTANLLNINANTITGTSANTTITAGAFVSTFNNQGNVLLPNVGVTGNVTAGGYFIGNGAFLTGIAASSNYSNVQVAAYLNTQGYNLYSNANVVSYLAGSITTGNITVSASNAAISLRDTTSGNTYILVGNTTGNYTATLPSVTGTLASLGSLAQTFAGVVTLTSPIINSSLTVNQGAGAITIGGGSATGNITLGQSSLSQNINIGAGNVLTGNTQTINIGTGVYTGQSLINIATGLVAGASSTVTIGASGIGTIGMYGTISLNSYGQPLTLGTSTGALNLGASQSTGAITLGGPGGAFSSGTGNIILGQSTATQLMNIQSAATGLGNTKTINVGINGAVGSNTVITIGPTLGVGNVTFSNNTVVTMANSLTVTGNVTATYFVGNGALLTGIVTSGGSNYGDSNVAAYLISGNISTGNLFTTGNIVLGNIASPTNTTANGLGLVIKGASDKRWWWSSSTAAWTSNQQIDIIGGNGAYKLANQDVITQDSASQITLAESATWTTVIVAPQATALTLGKNASTVITVNGNIANVRLGPSGQLTFADGTTQTTAASGTGGSNYSNVNVKAYTETMGFQNYGNVNVAAFTSGLTNYSNINTAAYLSTASITTTGNITAAYVSGNISVVGNVTGTQPNVTIQAGVFTSVFNNQGNVTLPNVYVSGNVQTSGYLFGNGFFLTGIVSSGGGGGTNYSNANVSSYLPTYSGNIANITLSPSGVLTFADGTTQTTAGGGSYSNVNVSTFLANSSTVFIGNVGNVATVYPLQSNITQVFIGGNTVITSGNASNPNATFLMYNGYFSSNGEIRVRNTTTGMGYLAIEASGFTLAGYTGPATANTLQARNIFLTINGSTGAVFSGIVSSPGVTSTGAVAVNSASGITTNQASFPLVNATATSIQFGGAATSITMGSTTGTGNVFFGGNAVLQAPNAALGTTLYPLVLRPAGQYNYLTVYGVAGGYNSPPYTNQALTGGNGTGMTASYSSVGGYVSSPITVTNPGTGYKNGDILTLPGGLGSTVLLNNYNATKYSNTASASYTFGFDGNLILPGNIIFPSSSYIFGDFSNATVNSRTVFMTTGNSATTGIYAVPSGTGTGAAWQAANSSNLTAASKIMITTNGSTDVQLVSGINGSGTYLPLSFYNNGSAQMQLTVAGNLNMTVNNSVSTSGTGYFIGNSVGTTATYTGNITALNIFGNISSGSSGNLNVIGNLISTGYGFFPGAYNESATTSGVFIGNTGSGTPTPRIGFYNGNVTQNWQVDNYFGTFRWFVPGTTQMSLDPSGNLAVLGTSANALVVSGGTVLQGNLTINGINAGYAPNRPAFRISGNGASISATTTVSGGYMVVDYNQGSYLNTSTGLFTAPVAGLYQVNLVVRASSNTGASAQAIIRKTTAIGSIVTAQIMIEYAANTTMNHTGGSTLVKMAVGDTLKFDVTLGTISFDGNDNWSVAYIG